VFRYQGCQVSLFIYYVKKKGGQIKELSPKIRAAQCTAKKQRDTWSRGGGGQISARDHHVPHRTTLGEPPGTDGLQPPSRPPAEHGCASPTRERLRTSAPAGRQKTYLIKNLSTTAQMPEHLLSPWHSCVPHPGGAPGILAVVTNTWDSVEAWGVSGFTQQQPGAELSPLINI